MFHVILRLKYQPLNDSLPVIMVAPVCSPYSSVCSSSCSNPVFVPPFVSLHNFLKSDHTLQEFQVVENSMCFCQQGVDVVFCCAFGSHVGSGKNRLRE